MLATCAILIPTRNRPEILSVTLSELAKAGVADFPLWVYDDASENRAAIGEVVAKWEGAQLIRGEERLGQAAGRNILMKSCDCEYAILLDDDSYFLDTGSLREYLGAERPPGTPCVVAFQCFAIRDGSPEKPRHWKPRSIRRFVGGWCLLHIRSVLAVGGFRDFFVYGCEEPELAFRLQAAGHTIWYDPSIVVQHNQWDAPKERRNTREYDFLYARNGLLMSSLNMPLWLGLPHGLARSIRFTFNRKRNISAKLRGMLAGLAMTFVRWRYRRPASWRFCVRWIMAREAG